MRVLQVAHGFPPRSIGGVEYHLAQLVDALRGHGVESDVFCRIPDSGRPDYSFSETVSGESIILMVVNNGGWDEADRQRYRNRRIRELFETFLKRRQPQIVHFHHLIALSADLPEVAHIHGVRAVMTLHDYWLACPRIQLLRPDGTVCGGPEEGEACARCDRQSGQLVQGLNLARKLYRRLPAWLGGRGKRVYYAVKPRLSRGPKEAGEVDQGVVLRYRERLEYMRAQFDYLSCAIAPSRSLGDFYARQGFDGEKIRVMPHGLAPLVRRPVSRPPRRKLRVCFVGSLMPHKGVHILVDAMEMAGPDLAEAVLYGQRPDQWYARDINRRLQQPSLRHVRWLGAYQTTDLPAIFAAVDVLVVPSIWPEAFSLVTREAFQAGVPVIGSDLGGIREGISPEVNGIVFPAGDREALRGWILRLAREPELLERLKAGARATAVLPMSEYAGEVAALYRSVL